MRTRVVVVDDDELSRRGIAEWLKDRAEIELVGAISHDEAKALDSEWDSIDVAIVDAADDTRDYDQFPGVRVVDLIRQRRSAAETTVIVITERFFDDAIRRRMREAKADFFFHRSELKLGSALQDAVLHPERARAGVPDVQDPEGLFLHGVVESTRVNKGVDFARDSGLQGALAKRGATRSRVWTRIRREFNDRARLSRVNADGTLPERDLEAPSLPQIKRFLDWATRVKDGR